MVAYSGKKSNTATALLLHLAIPKNNARSVPFRFIYPKQPVERRALFVLEQRRK